MTTTTYDFGRCIVHIHDPADTPEAKAKQRARIEAACIRFWKAMEAERFGRTVLTYRREKNVCKDDN